MTGSGLCFTPAEEDALARGWPHEARLVDGHPHDRSPSRSALAWLATYRDDKYRSEWPREVAYRVMRFGPYIRIAGATHPRVKLRPLDMKNANASGPPSVAEVRKALASMAERFTAATVPMKVCHWVLLAETLIGTDETLDAIAEGFERAQVGRRTDSFKLRFKQGAASLIGFLLLRSSRRGAHVKRLRAQLARFAAGLTPQSPWRLTVSYLDASLHGAPAVKRRFVGQKSVFFAEYAADDPDYVRECAAEDKTAPMSVRLVAIAGTDVLKDITRRRYEAESLPAVVRDFGMIRAPETVELIVSLMGKSSAKDAPRRWLAAHEEYARPIVERAAKRGDTAAKRALSVWGR